MWYSLFERPCHRLRDSDLNLLLSQLSTNTRAKEYAIEMGIIESIDRLLQDIKTLDTPSTGLCEY